MADRPRRVYADTSVYGGVREAELSGPSKAFFDRVRNGHFVLVSSPLVEQEVAGAPKEVLDFALAMFRFAEPVDITDPAVRLQQAYVRAGIVGASTSADALHVALASVAGCAMIVSWNFRHIVHFDKIPLYNAVNTLEGHGPIGIYSPLEVIRYEGEGA
jgi:predicted nucleic acid-binding protein